MSDIQITEITITIAPDHVKKRDRVLAFIKIVLNDSIAIREIKLMLHQGFALLGMPSRKLTAPCAKCGSKASKVDRYCHNCGAKLSPQIRDKRECFVDVVFPINKKFRSYLERQIVDDYNSKVDPEDRVNLRDD